MRRKNDNRTAPRPGQPARTSRPYYQYPVASRLRAKSPGSSEVKGGAVEVHYGPPGGLPPPRPLLDTGPPSACWFMTFLCSNLLRCHVKEEYQRPLPQGAGS